MAQDLLGQEFVIFDKNYSLKIFDDNSRGSLRRLNAAKKIFFVRGDIRDKRKFLKHLKEPMQ